MAVLTSLEVERAVAGGARSLMVEPGTVVPSAVRARAAAIGLELLDQRGAATPLGTTPAMLTGRVAPPRAIVPPRASLAAPARPSALPVADSPFAYAASRGYGVDTSAAERPAGSAEDAGMRGYDVAPSAAEAAGAGVSRPTPLADRPRKYADKRDAWRDDRSIEAIQICQGEWCQYDGSKELLQDLRRLVKERGLRERINVRGVPCMALCQAGPIVKVMPDYVRYWDAQAPAAGWMLDQHFAGPARDQPGPQDAPGIDSSPLVRPPLGGKLRQVPPIIASTMQRLAAR